jgi:predicted DNA-binding transcriptional regulator
LNSDQVLGAFILVGSIIGVVVYGALLFLFGEAISLLTLQVSAFLAVAFAFGILAWIGYTLATTPPPKPIEEVEKEVEEELKKLEAETKETETESEAKEEKKS